MSHTARESWLVAWRYAVRFLHQPGALAFTVAQPIMFVLLFRYVFGGAITVPKAEGTYVSYLMPGIMAQTCAFASMGTAVGLAEDLGSGMIDRFRALPISRSAVLAGRLLFDGGLYLAVLVVMVAAGYAVGFRFTNGPLAALVMVLMAVAFGLTMSCISAFVGMRLRNPETVMSMGLVWLFPLCFVSAAFVPVAAMPGWLQAFAKISPVTVVADAMRALAHGGPLAGNALASVAWMVAIAALFAPLAVRTYRRAA